MGCRKQLLVLPGRGTLLSHAVAQARILSRHVHAVVGCGYPLVRYRCRQQPSRWIYHPHWQLGLSGSLIAGVHALSPQALGFFVLLGDQPLLGETGLTELARSARLSPDIAWAADYGSRVGVPAWIPRSLWPEITNMKGDAGAGVVLNRVGALAVAMPGVQQDVDTPADWQSIKRRLAEQA